MGSVVDATLEPGVRRIKARLAALNEQTEATSGKALRGTSAVVTPEVERPSPLKAAQERSEQEFGEYLARQAAENPSSGVRLSAQAQLDARAER